MLYHLSSGRLPGRLWWQVQLWQDWPGWRIHIYRKTIIITMITIKEYSESVPLWHLRFLPALAGSLLTPTVYLLITGFPFTSALGEWSFSLLLYLPDTPLTPFTIDANSTPLKMLLDNVIILQSSVSHLMLEPLLVSWLSSTRRYLHSQGNADVDCFVFCFCYWLLPIQVHPDGVNDDLPWSRLLAVRSQVQEDLQQTFHHCLVHLAQVAFHQRTTTIIIQVVIIIVISSLSGVLAASAFCVKYIGIYTGFLVTFLLVQVKW